MNKRTFWQRTNRGFWISMVILAVVIAYVIGSQVQLAQTKNKLVKISEDVVSAYTLNCILSDEQRKYCDNYDFNALIKSPLFAEKRQSLYGSLKPLLNQESPYFESNVNTVLKAILDRSPSDRAANRTYKVKDVYSCKVLSQVASMDVTFYADSEEKDPLDEYETTVSLTFKKIKGEWKAERIGDFLTEKSDY